MPPKPEGRTDVVNDVVFISSEMAGAELLSEAVLGTAVFYNFEGESAPAESRSAATAGEKSALFTTRTCRGRPRDVTG